MLGAFLTYMNCKKVLNPMDKIYGNLEKYNQDHHIHLSLKNIFRKEK